MITGARDRVAIVGARLIRGDGTAPSERSAVVIAGGVIEDVLPDRELSASVTRVDHGDATILPGLVNLHSHMVPRDGNVTSRVLRAAAKAAAYLRAGITTSRDLGAPDYLDVELRDAIRAGATSGPDLIVAGRPITRTGGHNHAFSREADGEVEVRRAVREQLKAGASCIKLMASEGWGHAEPRRLGLSVAELAAAADEARRIGLRTTVHAQGPDATRNALLAGVDSVEHGTDGITDEVIQLFLRTGIPLVSTSSSTWVAAHWDERSGEPRARIERAQRHVASETAGLARCVAAGVRIAGAVDFYGTMPVQLRILREAGMAGPLAIQAITSIPASILGREDIGVIARGKRADLLAVDGDPLEDPGALERVVAVYKAGARVAASG